MVAWQLSRRIWKVECSMAHSLLPDMLRDDTGYNTEGNQTIEVGWREVVSGLNKVLLGNVLSIGGAIVLIWFLIGVVDMSKHIHSASKVDWKSNIALIGVIVFFGIQVCAFGLMLRGQWMCMNAPERRYAKQFMFGCMLCIIAMPLLNIGAGIIGGIDNLFTVTKSKAGVSEYMQLAGGILGLFSSVLFVFFLKAVADCFDNKVCSVMATLYILFCMALTFASVYLVIGYANAFNEYKEVTKALKQTQADIVAKGGLLLLVLGGWTLAYFWYLYLIIAARSSIARSFAAPSKKLAMA